MKTENLLLISDAQESLRKVARAEAQRNHLAAAFLGWLLREEEWTTLLTSAAESAAGAKGADRNSRKVAMLGYACGDEALRSRFAAEFVRQLEWCMGRPHFAAGGEPCGIVADPLNFAGVVIGAESVLEGEFCKRFKDWAAAVWTAANGLVEGPSWRRGMLNTMGWRIGTMKEIHADREPIWLAASLHARQWSIPIENSVSLVLKAAITNSADVTDGFEAGLRLSALAWAVGRAMDFDIVALTVSDVVTVLQRIPTVFQRWTWEDKPRTSKHGAQARRWHIENEYHFQSLLYTVLKPLIPSLDEEQYLPSTGTYQPRADLCILALELVVEVKFWYKGKSVKHLTEEIAADLTLYLRPDSPYQGVITAIWDDGARTEEQAELKRGLKGLNGLLDVVIVNRPSWMSERATLAHAGKKKSKKSQQERGNTDETR